MGLIDNVFVYDEFLSDGELTAIQLACGIPGFNGAQTPEPAALALIGGGLAVMAGFTRRRR